MGVQRGMAVHQLFIDFQEVNDSEEEYATTVSLGVLYLHLELVCILVCNIALGPVNILNVEYVSGSEWSERCLSNRHSEGPRIPEGLKLNGAH
jgi:hypothetical protein